MTLAYLLDTDIVSDLVRHPQGRVAARIARAGEDSIAVSVIVAAELRYGAAKRGSSRLTAQLNAILGRLPVLSLEQPTDEHYASIRTALEAKGTPIGSNDLFIAAHARAQGLILVTDNTREFRRVPGLKTENWLR